MKNSNQSLPLKLHLIRHGETEWSLSGQHTGTSDIPLTSQGEEDAKGLVPRLEGISFTHVFTSPLQRARRTCELALTDPNLELEPDLVEWDYGDYDGQRSEEILEQKPDWNLFHDGSPNGETPTQVSDRADRLIARLRRLKGNIAIFTHGHFGRVLAVRWIGLPLVEGEHFKLGTGSLSILGYDPHHPQVPVIERWNEISHQVIEPKTTPSIDRWENEGGEIST